MRFAERLGRALVATALTACFATGCAASFPRIDKSFDFFAPARPEDPFYPKVVEWQGRARDDTAGANPATPLPPNADDPDAYPLGVLRFKFDAFLNRHKRDLAREFTSWSQRQARLHFVADPATTLAGDHWPTLTEFFQTNGDDCDGLDLIAYGLMRDAGFRADETFRLVVRRESDGANHMVTLWFEERDDPWVIDATGAMTLEMRRFSDLPAGWLPRVMFNENEFYNVVERGPGRYELAREGAHASEASQ
jgi:hypothetical protein